MRPNHMPQNDNRYPEQLHVHALAPSPANTNIDVELALRSDQRVVARSDVSGDRLRDPG
jgi:hypothetical protein